jgi:uncharacterized LabA/DUF88 family protein
MPKAKKHLQLKSPSCVFIDWANVYNWKKSLKREVDPKKLYKYLKTYKEIEDVRFYFGKDKHKKSRAFLKNMRKIGYKVTTKPVKYILVTQIDNQKIYRRKCDFDMEMCIDVHKALAKGVESFIFFTGDGDFEPLYKLLIKEHKKVIVVYSTGHLGREIWNMKKGIFKVELKNLIKLT